MLWLINILSTDISPHPSRGGKRGEERGRTVWLDVMQYWKLQQSFAFAGCGGGQPSILVHKYTQSGQAVAGYQARREEDTDLQHDHGGNINTTFSGQYRHLNIESRAHISLHLSYWLWQIASSPLLWLIEGTYVCPWSTTSIKVPYQVNNFNNKND